MFLKGLDKIKELRLGPTFKKILFELFTQIKKGKEVENRHFEKLKLRLKASYFANKLDSLKC